MKKLSFVFIIVFVIISFIFLLKIQKEKEQTMINPSNTLPSVEVENIEQTAPNPSNPSPVKDIETSTNPSPQELYITAKGIGKPPTNMPKGQAKAMAKRAAIADAQRNLLESIQAKIGVEKNNNFLKNAKVVSEQQLSDGTYEVEMAVTIAPSPSEE